MIFNIHYVIEDQIYHICLYWAGAVYWAGAEMIWARVAKAVCILKIKMRPAELLLGPVFSFIRIKKNFKHNFIEIITCRNGVFQDFKKIIVQKSTFQSRSVFVINLQW